jgi:hypothetical protein
MDRYEYRREWISEYAIEKDLNSWGAKGYELIHVEKDTGSAYFTGGPGYFCILKRRVEQAEKDP